MRRLAHLSALALAFAIPLTACSASAAAAPPGAAPSAAPQRPGGGGGGGDSSNDGPKPYAEVITEEAVTQRGMFDVHTVGDDLFFETLRTYADRFSNGNATTEDFVSLAEEITDRDLGELFSTWLYDEQIPA